MQASESESGDANLSPTIAKPTPNHVLLVFPPLNALILHPELGIPQLLAYLRQSARQAEAVDLNALFLRNLWTQEGTVASILRGASAAQRGELVGLTHRIAALRLRTMEELDQSAMSPIRGQHAEGLAATILAMTDGMVYTPLAAMGAPGEASVEQAWEAWQQALALPAEHQWTVRRILAYWVDTVLFRPSSFDSSSIAARVGRPCPLYDEFLGDTCAPLLRQSQVLGISIQASEQVVPALKLAEWARRSGWAGHVTIGGPWVRAAAHNLARLSPMWNSIDSVVVGEGERPLEELLCRLDGREKTTRVPGMLVKGADGILDGGPGALVPLEQLPPPDYRFVDWDCYPEQAVAFRTVRGCYWSRCTFCFHVDQGESECSGRVAVQGSFPALEALLKGALARGVSTLRLADNATPPAVLDVVATEIQRLPRPVEWEALARFDVGFNPERCRRLAGSGLRGLMFGLEVADDAQLRRLDKGVTMDLVVRNLQVCTDAGIRTSVFVLDYPTLPLETLQQTLDFCCEHAEIIHWIMPYGFQLGLNAHVMSTPWELGLELRVDPADWYSVFDVPFTAPGWRSGSDVSEFFRRGLVRFAAIRSDLQNRRKR